MKCHGQRPILTVPEESRGEFDLLRALVPDGRALTVGGQYVTDESIGASSVDAGMMELQQDLYALGALPRPNAEADFLR